MQRQLRIIIRVCTLLIAGMCLFPPWNEYSRNGHNLGSAGYAFIVIPPEGSRLDLYRLLVQIAVVAMLGAGFAFTMPKDASEGMFQDERKFLTDAKARLQKVLHRSKSFLIVFGGLILLAVAWLYSQRVDFEQQQFHQEQKLTHEKQVQEKQNSEQQARAELSRQTLYRPHKWPVKNVPKTRMNVHFESWMDGTQSLSYKVWLSGPADQLETISIYYSTLEIYLLNAQGLEVTHISIPASALVKTLNGSGGLPTLEKTGSSFVNEPSYAAVRDIKLRPY